MISLQKSGSVGAKNCLVTTWPLCKGLKLSLFVEEVSTGLGQTLSIHGGNMYFRLPPGADCSGQVKGLTVSI